MLTQDDGKRKMFLGFGINKGKLQGSGDIELHVYNIGGGPGQSFYLFCLYFRDSEALTEASFKAQEE